MHRPHPVRYLLIRDGLSMASLVEQLGPNDNYEVVRKYINGDLRPPRDVAERIAAVLGLPVPALFRVEEIRDPEGVAA